MALPTVADLKIHLNIEGTGNDGELADHLDAAVAMVEGLIGPITANTVTETHYGVASPMLLLRQTPVGDLTAVTATYSFYDSTSLDVTDYVLDRAAGVVRLLAGGRFYSDVTVTYSVGRAQVSPDIRLAILIIAAHLWETQRMPGLSRDSSPAGFGGADGIPDMGNTGSGFAIPRRAEELLRAHMRGSVIA